MHTQCNAALTARQTAACAQPRAGLNIALHCASSRAAPHIEGLMLPSAENLLGSAVYLYFLSCEVRQDQQQPWKGRSFCLLAWACCIIICEFRALSKIH